jgi:uncharacterized damage-inducible protein DinB
MPMAATTPKRQFLDGFTRETATTLKVLRAYPPDKLDLRPSPRSVSARDLAWLFVTEQGLAANALTTGFDWSTPPGAPPAAPDSLAEIIKAVEEANHRTIGLVENTPDAQLTDTVKFFTGPKTLGDIPKIDFLWFLLCDQIHHRGQLSVYLRIAGGKVPSIYGPSGDEPWF